MKCVLCGKEIRRRNKQSEIIYIRNFSPPVDEIWEQFENSISHYVVCNPEANHTNKYIWHMPEYDESTIPI